MAALGAPSLPFPGGWSGRRAPGNRDFPSSALPGFQRSFCRAPAPLCWRQSRGAAAGKAPVPKNPILATNSPSFDTLAGYFCVFAAHWLPFFLLECLVRVHGMIFIHNQRKVLNVSLLGLFLLRPAWIWGCRPYSGILGNHSQLQIKGNKNDNLYLNDIKSMYLYYV